MTDYFERAVRQVLGRGVDEEPDERDHGNSTAARARVTLPWVHFLERELPP